MMQIVLSVVALMMATDMFAQPTVGRELNYGRSELGRALAPRVAVDLLGAWQTRKVPRAKKPAADEPAWTPVRAPHGYDLSKCWSDVCQYRRSIELPARAGRRVDLRIGAFRSELEIIVNGHVVATNFYPIPTSYDVTDLVHDGANDVQLNCRINQDPARRGVFPGLPVWSVWTEFGLHAPVWLEYHDAVAVSDVTVVTKVTPAKVFTARVEVTNATDAVRTVAIAGRVRGAKDAVAGLAFDEKAVRVPAHGTAVVAFDAPWPAAKLWTPDAPNLSYFDVELREEGKPRDGLRTRFGFREITIVGEELRMNGIPFCLRHDSCGGWSPEDTPEEIVRRYRSRGVNSMRTGTDSFAVLGDAADEQGFMFLLGGASGPGAKNCKDAYWANKKAHDRMLAKAYKNRPSVVVWYLSCEFGGVYNAEGPNERELVAKCQDMGANMAATDPTRPWLCSGDIECGYPIRGPGPMPLRSFHYPFGPGGDGSCLPESAYWYAKGGTSWQGVSTKDKPLLIDEDFYHGLNDSFHCATKWAGDRLYSDPGWLRAWYDCVRMFADGYYDAGISGWEIWVAFPAKKRNRLFDLVQDQMMPDYLIALRETYPNFRGGTEEARGLKVFSRTFTDRRATLVRRLALDGKFVSETARAFTLPAGRFWEGREQIAVPRVTKPTAFDIVYELKADGRTLTTRRYEGTAFPEEPVRFPAGAVLLAPADSPLVKLPDVDRVATAVDAIASGKPIVVAGHLSAKDGLILKQHVIQGGRVMLVELDDKSWTPAQLVFGRHQAFVWRRAEGALPGLDERMLRVWRPDAEIGDSGYVKDAENAFETLLDTGHAKGIDELQAGRLYMGGGHWFLVQLPVVSRLGTEPAAAFALNALFDEFVRGLDVKKSFREGAWPRLVVELDAAGLDYLKKLGTSLDALGLEIAPVTNAVEWVTRTSNAGLMRGISNDDLFLSLVKPSDTCWNLYGRPLKSKRSIVHGILVSRPGSKAVVHTEPGAIAEVEVGGRRLALTTLKLKELLVSYPRKTGFLVRALALNLGVNTAAVPPDVLREPRNLQGVMNRRLWTDPRFPNDRAWFENGNDMRYFPVNLCGWSLDSNNKCPVQAFPREPINLAGLPFRIPYDAKTDRSACLVVEPGETVTIPSWEREVTGVHFLGAGDQPKANGKGGVLEARYGYRHPPENRAAKATAKTSVFRYGDHFNCYRWAGGVRSGKVVWSGDCQLDRSAALYTWFLKSELNPEAPLAFIDLTNTGDAPVAILGLTFEKRIR